MAKPGRMKEVEAEQGEQLITLIPRLLNEKGSIPAVARVIGVADRTLFIYCQRNGIRKQCVWFIQSQQCKDA